MGILDNTKFMLNVCEMYYIEGLSQKQIAGNLGISTAQISRIIALAQTRKLVSFHLNYPNSEENEYQDRLKQKYGIREVYVYDIGKEEKDANRILAEKSYDLFSVVVKDGERVGVMAGKTMRCLANAIPCSKNRRLEFVPLCGGYATDGLDWYANAIAQEFAEKTNGKYYVFNAPQYVLNEQTKKILLEEPHIKQVVELGKHCNVSLIGIGTVKPSSTGGVASELTEEDSIALEKVGAVANICSSYVDGDGNVIETKTSDRILGSSILDIKESRKVGVARGIEKVPAIKAVLKGHLLDVFITSLETAKQLA
jgi:DNA-binding transcriptional regulator LsrR (DeoR family)